MQWKSDARRCDTRVSLRKCENVKVGRGTSRRAEGGAARRDRDRSRGPGEARPGDQAGVAGARRLQPDAEPLGPVPVGEERRRRVRGLEGGPAGGRLPAQGRRGGPPRPRGARRRPPRQGPPGDGRARRLVRRAERRRRPGPGGAGVRTSARGAEAAVGGGVVGARGDGVPRVLRDRAPPGGGVPEGPLALRAVPGEPRRLPALPGPAGALREEPARGPDLRMRRRGLRPARGPRRGEPLDQPLRREKAPGAGERGRGRGGGVSRPRRSLRRGAQEGDAPAAPEAAAGARALHGQHSRRGRLAPRPSPGGARPVALAVEPAAGPRRRLGRGGAPRGSLARRPDPRRRRRRGRRPPLSLRSGVRRGDLRRRARARAPRPRGARRAEEERRRRRGAGLRGAARRPAALDGALVLSQVREGRELRRSARVVLDAGPRRAVVALPPRRGGPRRRRTRPRRAVRAHAEPPRRLLGGRPRRGPGALPRGAPADGGRPRRAPRPEGSRRTVNPVFFNILQNLYCTVFGNKNGSHRLQITKCCFKKLSRHTAERIIFSSSEDAGLNRITSSI